MMMMMLCLRDVSVKGVTEVEQKSVDDVRGDANDADVPKDEEEDVAEIETQADHRDGHQQQHRSTRHWVEEQN